MSARADRRRWKVAPAVAAAVGALAAAGMPVGHAATQLVGAGSTFDLPFFNAAFPAYQSKTGVSVTYSGIGSGGGIEQFTNNTVDFGATDVPMDASEMQAAQATGSSVVQVPVALGGVAIAYNVPEVPRDKPLRLDAATLSNIFLDKITRWNDPAIATLNPGIHLPLTPILTVHRSDASGTSYIVTDYLSAVSKPWASAIGTGKSVSWPPNSLGGKGNPGVAAALSQHAGAIGYVELAYAINYKIPYAEIQNKAGSFQFPSPTTVRAAAAQFPHVSYKNFSIVNAPGRESYPIAGYSWILLRRHPKVNASDLVKLFKWVTTSGQSYAAKLIYVGLPTSVQKLAADELNSIK